MDHVESLAAAPAEVQHESEVGVVLGHPQGVGHADICAGGVAEHQAVHGKLAHSHGRIAAGCGEQLHMVPRSANELVHGRR